MDAQEGATEAKGTRIVLRQYTLEEFEDYLRKWRQAGAEVKATFVHHTWKPTSRDYVGLATIEAIRRAHLQRGFSDIACNAYACPDGKVVNARPPGVANCACQAPEKPATAWPAELRRLSGGDKRWPNRYGFGVEVVGNFDDEQPETSVAMRTGLDVLALVHQLWAIPVGRCFLHRDVAYKSCPGRLVSREWVHAELRRRLEMKAEEVEADVDDWAKEAVDWAKKEKLLMGYADGSFGGRRPVTRQELAVVLQRLVRRQSGESS